MPRDYGEMQKILSALLLHETPITGVSPMTTGFSNETYLIEGPELILRLPPAAGAMLDGHDVVGQALIYEALGQIPGAPTVPQIVHVEEGAGLLGAPFFVMERIDGESIDDMTMTPWFVDGNNALRRQICRDWISAYSALSQLEPLPMLGPVVSPEDDARMWREFGRKADCPELVAMFDRLLAKPAPISGPPAIIHGDPKLSNLMWKDQRIVAMLDWEMALNGEPLANLGYMLFFFASDFHVASRAQKLPGMLTREEVIALWESVSGRSALGIGWHEISQAGKLGAIIAEGANMANSGRSQDPRLEVFKQNLGYYLGVVAAMLDAGGY